MSTPHVGGAGSSALGWPDVAPDGPPAALGWPESPTVVFAPTALPPLSAPPVAQPPAAVPSARAELAPAAASADGSPSASAVSRAGDGSMHALDRVAKDDGTHSVAAPLVEPGAAGAIADVSRETRPSGGPADANDGSWHPREALADVQLAERPLPVAPVADLVDVSRETGPLTVDVRPAASAVRAAPLPPPADTRVLTVANQKGGVGKTTTTVNLAAALALHGAQVLVIDLDPQGNASTALGVDHRAEVPSVYDVLVEGRPLHEVVAPAPGIPGLACAPATVDLAGAEIELVSLVARELRLQRALRSYLTWRAEHDEPRLDYVFIDCPPSLGLLTVNALVAAPEVLIPIQCEYYALEGVGQLVSNVELVKAHLNQELHVSTILLTMYDARTRLAAQVADDVRRHFTDVVLRTTIPRSVRISEAPSYGQTVMTYDPASTGALSYREAAREIAFRAASVPTP